MESLLQEIHPEYFGRMQRLLGADFESFFEQYRQPLPTGLRVNKLKLSPQAFAALAPFDLAPLPGIEAAFTVSGDEQPGKHPYHSAGLYYLQDPSAMVAAQLLDPQPGERVLDLSASPGGKATQIASLMKGEGILVANEVDPKRAWDLAENLERWGVRRLAITNAAPAQMAAQLEASFDRVLVDAPCSGEGMFLKSASARLQWTPALVQSCALRQQSILHAAARMIKPGGRLVYATCTFAPEENEAVIGHFLDQHPDFELVEPAHLPGFAPGRPGWASASNLDLHKTVRLWPHLWPGGGQFIAVLRSTRRGNVQPPEEKISKGLPREAGKLFEVFYDETLLEAPPIRNLHLVGSYVYAVPEGMPDLGALKAIHPGWWLGTVRKNRFEPSHALALALDAANARRVVNLASNGAEIRPYLRGETLDSEGDSGWVLVCVDGFPAGWGKRAGGKIKNHYPHGLRLSY
ncbi:MAG: hypothetical protein EHM70_01320 [Chloroflexota bacterium]|nr:MAG: hypothetical protein EHM70_01320 [Chloroflexota bacterium]